MRKRKVVRRPATLLYNSPLKKVPSSGTLDLVWIFSELQPSIRNNIYSIRFPCFYLLIAIKFWNTLRTLLSVSMMATWIIKKLKSKWRNENSLNTYNDIEDRLRK